MAKIFFAKGGFQLGKLNPKYSIQLTRLYDWFDNRPDKFLNAEFKYLEGYNELSIYDPSADPQLLAYRNAEIVLVQIDESEINDRKFRKSGYYILINIRPEEFEESFKRENMEL